MTEADIDRALRKLPPIRRARFWRLYAEDGSRVLDLWQDGGRGILGARHAKLGRGLSALIDRGLDRPLPSRLEARLAKAALALAPGAAAVRIYRNEDRALAVLARLAGREVDSPAKGAKASLGGLFDSPFLFDPARRVAAERVEGPSDPAAAAPGDAPTVHLAVARILRPFSRWLAGAGASPPDIAMPLLPLPRGLGPAILLFDNEAKAAQAGPGDLVSPLALGAAVDSLSALSAYEKAADEAQWRRFDRHARHLFDRRGPWLHAKAGVANWERVFGAALDRGILLSPDPELPSIVPGDFDEGEVAPLAAIQP